MRWDSSRPVPWRRLTTEWVVVTVALIVFMLVVVKPEPSAYASLLVGGVVYLGIGYVLAKLGYQRATVQAVRHQQRQQAAAPTSPQRQRPAPTKRTGGGRGRKQQRKRR